MLLEGHVVEPGGERIDPGIGRRVIFGVGFLLFDRQLAPVGDRQAASEDVVAAHLQLGLGRFRQAVANGGKRGDQTIERRVVADFDIVFDACTHGSHPSPERGLVSRCRFHIASAE
jgi:hypothetical protein